MDQKDMAYFETQYDPQARIEAFSGFGRKEMATDCRRLLAAFKDAARKNDALTIQVKDLIAQVEKLGKDLEASKNLVRAEQEEQKRKVDARVKETVSLKDQEIDGLKTIIGIREKTIVGLTQANEKIKNERDETERRNAILHDVNIRLNS